MMIKIDLNKMNSTALREFKKICKRQGVTPELLFLRCAEARLREVAFADKRDADPLFRLLNDLLPECEEL